MSYVFRNTRWPWQPRRNTRRIGIEALDARPALVGQAATTQFTTVVAKSDLSVTGVAATSQFASLAPTEAQNLSGVAATTQLTAPSLTITSNVNLSGDSATASVGVPVGDHPAVFPSGVAATTQFGIPFTGDRTNALFGVQAIAQINSDAWAVNKVVNLAGVKVTAAAFIIGGLAAGGGGGGAAGPTGPGQHAGDGSGTGTGGAGGAGDAGVVPAQTTPGATGNSGTEFDGVFGVGSGGGGANFGDNPGGNGGQYGGGGGGGTGAAGGTGGDGIVVLRYLGSGAVWKEIVLRVANNAASPLIMPPDWSNTNFVYLLSSGGCGSGGTHYAGGNGGAGGNILWGQDVAVFAPGQTIPYHIPSGCEVGFLTFGDYSVENGGNATNTSAGLPGTHYTSWPGGHFAFGSGGTTGYVGVGIGGAGGGLFSFSYQGSNANPLSVFATAQAATFSLAGVMGDRVFIITSIKQDTIAAGIVMLPTSEDIALGATPYVIGSSQFYTVGEVWWNGVKRVQGTDWELVSPFGHIVHILNTAGIITPIQLIYYRWDIEVRQGFRVNSYPVPFGFTGTTIVAERAPQPNLFFTVEYTASRPGLNPTTMFARYPTIVDDLLSSHTLYDGSSGFETFRPSGFTVFDTSDNKTYTWNGSAWGGGVAVPNATKFYVKRLHAIYELSGGVVSVIFTAGDPLTLSIPEAISYPPFGESIGKNLLVDAFSPNAAVDFPSAYEIAQRPGDFDQWATG